MPITTGRRFDMVNSLNRETDITNIIREYQKQKKVTRQIAYQLVKQKNCSIQEDWCMSPIETLLKNYRNIIPCKNEILHQMFLSGRSKEYNQGIQKLLWLAAQYDDERGFQFFLNHAESADGLISESTNDIFLNLGMESASDLDIVTDTVFLTRDEKYLDYIIEKFGVNTSGFSCPRTYWIWEGGKCNWTLRTSLPAAYVVILSGDVPMAQYYLKKGFFRKSDCMEEVFAIGKNNVSINSGTKIGHTVETYISQRMEGSGSVCNDILSAAILSKSSAMIRFVGEHFPQVRWNRGLEWCLLKADRKLSGTVGKYYPEIFGYIRLDQIVLDRNPWLLNRYLKIKTIQEQEMKDALHLLLEYPRRWEEKGSVSGRERKMFYSRIIEYFGTVREIRDMVKRAIFAELACNPENEKEFVQMLKELQEGGETYTMEVFTYKQFMAGRSSLAIIGECDREFRIPIDLYEIETTEGIENMYVMVGYHKKGMEKKCGQILIQTTPVRIEPRTDWFTRKILETGSLSLVKKAIKNKFITRVNVQAILEAADCCSIKQEIRMLLYKVTGQDNASLTEKYKI